MNTKKYASILTAGLMVAAFTVGLPVFAESTRGFERGMDRIIRIEKTGIVGTVSVVSGNTITIIDKKTNTSDTVDASGATVIKAGATSTVSSIAVGDDIMVQGTISGSVTATAIIDGMPVTETQSTSNEVAGTVSSISGTTITVINKLGPDGTIVATYTVNASGATVTKNGAASSVSSIAVGDRIVIQGTFGTINVTAKKIVDGVPQSIQGNGQPVVAGSVTVISGNTITITNKSNVTYTVDATNARFVVKEVTNPTISNIAVGDNITVQGTVNGNSVTASSIIDQKAKNENSNGKPARGFMGGMMNGIGNFFKHMFGF
jgi:hypothetical protein